MTTYYKRKLTQVLKGTSDMAFKRRAIRIIEELELQAGDEILDAGCGWGNFLDVLTRLGLRLKLAGIDIDEGSLITAKKILKGTGVKLFKADIAKKLPFKSNSFDGVIMSEVAEHLPDDKGGLSEVYRVLKRGGRFCFTVPNKNYPFLWDPVNWVSEHFFSRHIKEGFWAGIWSNHLRLYSPSEARKLLEQAGFRIEKVESLTWWAIPFNHNLLYGGKLERLPSGLSNYLAKQMEESRFNNFALRVLNFNDKLNDLIKTRNVGVGVFIKAVK
jgi:ubiquinone/menaquinone biosynthesis C-methylase UbiE